MAVVVIITLEIIQSLKHLKNARERFKKWVEKKIQEKNQDKEDA